MLLGYFTANKLFLSEIPVMYIISKQKSNFTRYSECTIFLELNKCLSIIVIVCRNINNIKLEKCN